MARPVFEMVWKAVDTAAGLHQRYRREADGEVRTRLQGLWLLRTGQPVAAVAAAVGVHSRTVQRWVSWYRAGGVDAVCTRQRGGKGQPAFLSAAQEAAVAAQAARGAFRTAAEARTWVAEQFGVAYRPKGIYGLLHRLRCHPKVPRPLHVQAKLEDQDAWKKGDARPPLVRRA